MSLLQGGETIAEMQKETNTKMKMSKANDFYPGTTERVCLISGMKDSIASVVATSMTKMTNFLNEKMRSRPEMVAGEEPQERQNQIKVIVPNSTAGMIIGKGGAYVKEMKERSGAFVQLSQKQDIKLPERVVTIVGEAHGNRIALEMILDKVEADPMSGSCQNISYGEMGGGMGGMTGGMGGGMSAGGMGAGMGGGMGASMGGFGSNGASSGPKNDTININGHTNLRLTLNVHAPTAPDPWVTSQAMPHINHALRQAGHSETVSDELTRALGLLAAHGVLQLTQSAALADTSTQQWAGEQAYSAGYGSASGYGDTQSAYGYGNPAQAQPPAPQPPGSGTRIGYGAQKPIGANRPSDYPPPASPPGPPGEVKPTIEREIQVEEKLVGAVLGPSGRHIVEIQQYSGSSVQISKKGVYAPGTRNRLVTIKGTQRGIESAAYLIQQKIQEEEEKRQRSGRT